MKKVLTACFIALVIGTQVAFVASVLTQRQLDQRSRAEQQLAQAELANALTVGEALELQRFQCVQERAAYGLGTAHNLQFADPVELKLRSQFKTSSKLPETSPANRQLNKIREAVLSGQKSEAWTLMRAYNRAGYAGGPVFFFDDPELAELGVRVRPRYNFGRTFAVTLHAESRQGQDARVIIPPGATVRADGRYQDVAVLDYRLIDVVGRRAKVERSLIACCEFGKDDPRKTRPAEFDLHQNKNVAKIATASRNLGSSWETAQVAIWAVTDNPSLSALLTAPGNYRQHNVREAEKVLLEAGLDPSEFKLWRGSSKAQKAPRFDSPRSFFGG